MARTQSTKLLLVLTPILASAIVLAGCVQSAAGVGAGTGTRYSEEGYVECSEAGTITARSHGETDTVEITLLAEDCPPPLFPDDLAYCLPSDCLSYTYWWPAADCSGFVGEVQCLHEGTYGPEGRTIVHEMEFQSNGDFRFDITEIHPGGGKQPRYHMSATLVRASE